MKQKRGEKFYLARIQSILSELVAIFKNLTSFAGVLFEECFQFSFASRKEQTKQTL